MSRQLIDTVLRIIDNSFLQIDKGKNKKALENLDKAEKLLQKVDVPELLCQTLMLKGRALLASGRQEEALVEFQVVLELSTDHFLEDAANIDYQYLIYNAIGFSAKTLREINNPSKTKESLHRNEKYFEEILSAYESLLAEKLENTAEPEKDQNIEYITNYLKTIENVRAFFIEARQLDKEVYFVGKLIQNYNRALEIQPDDEELFDDLDRDIRDFVRKHMIFKRPGDPKEILEQTESVYREILRNEPGNDLAFESLISLYEEFGDLYKSRGDIEKAEEILLRALNLLEEKIREQPEDIYYIQMQSEILQNLSRALSEEETEKAIQYAVKALEIIKELSGKSPENLDYQYEFADDFYELAELFREMCDFERAEEAYLLEIEIYRQKHEKDPGNKESIEDIAASYDQIGHLYAEEEKTEPAKHYFEQGIETYEKLLESDPGNLDHEIGISSFLNYIGELYKYPDPETARSYFEKALAINEKAVKLFPESTGYREKLIYTLKNLASTYTREVQYESATRLHERITEIRREIALENPGDYGSEKELGLSYSEFAFLLEKAEKPELAWQQYLKAVEVFRGILQNEEIDPLLKQLLATELRIEIVLLTHTMHHFIAGEYLELVHDYYKNLYENDPESEINLKGLYETQLLEGNLQETMKNYGIAAEKYESALLIILKRLESDPENPEYQEKASSVYTQLGSVYSLDDEFDRSKEAFEKALSINSKLLEKDPEDPLYNSDAADTFEEYAKLLEKLDRDEEAEEYSKKAEALKEKLNERELD